jgi:hypothetical protein
VLDTVDVAEADPGDVELDAADLVLDVLVPADPVFGAAALAAGSGISSKSSSKSPLMSSSRAPRR